MWQASLDGLPSRVNLMKQKVLIDAIYQSCGAGQETTLHALWMCLALVEVWTRHFGWLIRESRYCSNFLDVFQLYLEKSDLSDLFAITTSMIWT